MLDREKLDADLSSLLKIKHVDQTSHRDIDNTLDTGDNDTGDGGHYSSPLADKDDLLAVE